MIVKFKEWLKPSKGVKRAGIALCAVICSLVILGCSTLALIPTRVNPVANMVIEGDTPNYKGWTLQGIEDSRVEFLKAMYPVVLKTHELQREVSQNISNTILGVLSAVGLTGTGALPFAMKMLPKGAVKKEDYERDVAEALAKDPNEAV